MNLYKALLPMGLAVIGSTAAAQTTHTVPGDFATIQAAIDAATGGDTILVDPGTYVESIDYSGKELVIQSTAGAATTTIDGNVASTVVTIASGEGPGTVLEGFTIQRGRPGAQAVGGIWCKDSSPTIRDCVLKQNRAIGGVGALLCDNASPTAIGCEFSRNFGGARPAGPSAGAVTCENGSNFTAMDCQFLINQGLTFDQGGGDGVISCASQSTATFSDCVFTGNVGGRGGQAGVGVAHFEDSTGTFTDCTFNANSGGTGGLVAGDRGGDGVLEIIGSEVTLTRCTLQLNDAGVGGGNGAILAVDSTLEIVDSTVAQNSAVVGASGFGTGGAAVRGATSLTVLGSTFSDNIGVDGPGGIDIDQGASFLVEDSTFLRNEGASAAHAAGALHIRSAGLVVDCAFNANVGAVGAAGAVTIRNGGQIRACTFENNEGGVGMGPKAGAGALELQGQIDIVVRACEFFDNRGGAYPTGTGGAGAVSIRGPHDSLFENCLMWRNTGGDGLVGGAGAVRVNSGSSIGRTEILNATMTQNNAGASSGPDPGAASIQVTELSEPMIVNTILADNTGGDEIVCSNCATGPVVQHSVVTGGYPGTANLDVDPRFAGPLAGNFRLECPSPARDAGTSVGVSLPPRDLDGLPRVRDDEVDAGAYEYVSPGAGTRYCVALPNSTGMAALIDAGGCNSVGEEFLPLRARPVPNTVGLFYYGPAQIQIPFGDGFRCVGGGGGSFFRLRLRQIENNSMEQLLDYLNPANPAGRIFAGSTWNFQAVYRDPDAGGQDFNLSDAIEINFVQ